MSYNGTAVGSPTYTAGASGFGQAIVLNGSTQYVSVPTAAFNSIITAGSSWAISARFKSSGGAGQYVIASSLLTGTGAVFYITLQGGTMNCNIDGIGGITGGSSLADNAWHEVLLQVIAGKRATLWVDGTRVSTVNGTFSGRAADVAWIGGYAAPSLYWPGQLQDVAIYPSALYPPYKNYVPATAKLPATALYAALYNLDGGVTDSATAYTAVAYNAATVTYSPYNWGASANGTGYVTQSPGAYLRTHFTGTKLFLTMDNYANSDNTANSPQFSVRIDGGAWADYNAAGIVDVTPVALGNYRHYVQVALKTYNDIERWGTPTTDPRSAIVVTGLYISSGGASTSPAARPYYVLGYGDSISDGTKVNGSGGTEEANNDPKKSWMWSLLDNPLCEFGMVAYGGQAIDGTAHTNTVPPLKSSWNYIKDSLARSFTPAPNLIIILIGQNDDAGTEAATTASFTTVLQGLVAAAPAAKIVCLGPLSQLQATSIAAAVAAIGSGNVSYVSTVGWMPGFTSTDSPDTVHPYAGDLIGLIAAKAAPFAFAALAPAGSSNKGVLSRRGLGR